MRLIDADELPIRSIDATDLPKDGKGLLVILKEDIDNAPTIKTFTLLDIEEQYRKGLEKGLSEWETERPQGEWINYSATTFTCSNCKKNCPNFETYMKMNFCPNCGAEMVGGES